MMLAVTLLGLNIPADTMHTSALAGVPYISRVPDWHSANATEAPDSERITMAIEA